MYNLSGKSVQVEENTIPTKGDVRKYKANGVKFTKKVYATLAKYQVPIKIYGDEFSTDNNLHNIDQVLKLNNNQSTFRLFWLLYYFQLVYKRYVMAFDDDMLTRAYADARKDKTRKMLLKLKTEISNGWPTVHFGDPFDKF
jgi:hypothetical protein